MITITTKAIIYDKHPQKPSIVPLESTMQSTIAIPIGGHKANNIINPKYSNIFIWSLLFFKNNPPVLYVTIYINSILFDVSISYKPRHLNKK